MTSNLLLTMSFGSSGHVQFRSRLGPVQVLSRSFPGPVQVLYRPHSVQVQVRFSFNSLELDSEVGRLVYDSFLAKVLQIIYDATT